MWTISITRPTDSPASIHTKETMIQVLTIELILGRHATA